jgi:hypothetical protein
MTPVRHSPTTPPSKTGTAAAHRRQFQIRGDGDRSALRPSESPPKAPPSPRQTPRTLRRSRHALAPEGSSPGLSSRNLRMISGLQGVPTESPCRTDMVGAFGCLCLRWKMTDLGRDLPASRRGRGGPHRRERTPRAARLEALVRPRTAAGSRAAEPQRTPVADPVWRTWTRSFTRSPAASTHPDPATLLDISTTACRRMRSAPAPVQTRSPALLLGLHVFSALGGDGLGRSQA